jgi:hypothetical protein
LPLAEFLPWAVLAGSLIWLLASYTPPPTPPPAPPPAPPPGSYGPPSAGATQAPNAVTILILAIAGWVCCPILGLIAFIMAKNALQQYPNDGMTKASYWIGLIWDCPYQ